MNLVLITAAGAALGALVGGSQVLCPDGSCALTGSWYGGGLIGGCLAYGLAGMWLSAKASFRTRPPE